MKILAIQKTVQPSIKFQSYNDWSKWLKNEVNKLKKGAKK